MEHGAVDWKLLHDATLTSIELDWASGRAYLNFTVEIGEHRKSRIVVSGVKHLECPRECPWGESVSVNEVHSPNSEDGMLSIEMQSGDVIRVNAVEVTLEFAK